jgi:hypothetical protein
MPDEIELRRALGIIVGKILGPSMLRPEIIPPVFQAFQIRIGAGDLLESHYPLPNGVPGYSRKDLLQCCPIDSWTITAACSDNGGSITSEFIKISIPLESSSSRERLRLNLT